MRASMCKVYMKKQNTLECQQKTGSIAFTVTWLCMQVCFLSLSCALASSHTHAHTPTTDLAKGVLPPSPPLPHPNPCKVMEGLICRDHLHPSLLASKLCGQEEGKKETSPSASLPPKLIGLFVFPSRAQSAHRRGYQQCRPPCGVSPAPSGVSGACWQSPGANPTPADCDHCLVPTMQELRTPSQHPLSPRNLLPTRYST